MPWAMALPQHPVVQEELAKTLDKGPAIPDDLRLFARLENLIGQERALLAIPHDTRSAGEHRLLGEITAELDRLAEKLHERAQWKKTSPRPAEGGG
jgi:hypothetical protein